MGHPVPPMARSATQTFLLQVPQPPGHSSLVRQSQRKVLPWPFRWTLHMLQITIYIYIYILYIYIYIYIPMISPEIPQEIPHPYPPWMLQFAHFSPGFAESQPSHCAAGCSGAVRPARGTRWRGTLDGHTRAPGDASTKGHLKMGVLWDSIYGIHGLNGV